MALRLSGDPYDAEDLTQETFTVAHAKLHQLRHPDRCRLWLLAILRNLYRRGKDRRTPELLEVREAGSYASADPGASSTTCTPG